jgi:uncharacterized protein (TIGR02452 family)
MDPKRIANETLTAFQKGRYTSSEGVDIELLSLLQECLKGTRHFQPEELVALESLTSQRSLSRAPTTFSVTPETSLQGAARLSANKTYQRVAVLNFASARKPGGGFLGGAQAQEESLARSSGLYLSLLRCPEFYDIHRSLDTCLYSDRMIYSPRCPVVRDDAGLWLPTPYLVDFITSAAPNAGAIMRNEPHNRARIGPTVRERVGKVLALAAHYQVDALVLGAWGCGLFQNDPQLVAAAFYEWLSPGGTYEHRFSHVLFAVRDSSHDHLVYNAFANTLATLL